MAFNVNDVRAQLVAGGARPSNFQVQIQNPVNGVADIKVPFMVQASSLPARNIGEIPVSYFGREIYVAGTSTFDTWNVTVRNDEDFLIRNAMEQWINSINTLEGNLRNFTSASPNQYKAQAQVTQFSKTGVPIREYSFLGLWPTTIGEISLDWSDGDSIEVFDVTFRYDWYEVTGGTTGNAGGN